jgi:5-methyltetrahydrofolate--homocysteine methyltransferase
MKKYIANLSACADCFVFCYPNAGLPNAMGGYDQKGPEMAEEIRPFCEENLVNAIGGCCGSTPEHIAAIAGVFTLEQTVWLQACKCCSSADIAL